MLHRLITNLIMTFNVSPKSRDTDPLLMASYTIDEVAMARALFGHEPTLDEIRQINYNLLLLGDADMTVVDLTSEKKYIEYYPMLMRGKYLEVHNSETHVVDVCTQEILFQIRRLSDNKTLTVPTWFYHLCRNIGLTEMLSSSIFFCAIHAGKRSIGHKGRDAYFIEEKSVYDGAVGRMLKRMERLGLVRDVKKMTERQRKIYNFSGYMFREGGVWPNMINGNEVLIK